MAVVYDAQHALIRSILGPDSELHVRFNERSTCFISCASMEACNAVGAA